MASQSSPSSPRLLGVLVELGCPAGPGGRLVVLYGRAGELEGRAVGGDGVDDESVGDGLGIGCCLEGVLHHGPLAGEVGRAIAPLVDGPLGEDLSEQGGSLGGVLGETDRVLEARVGGQVRSADRDTRVGPVAGAWRQEKAMKESSLVR